MADNKDKIEETQAADPAASAKAPEEPSKETSPVAETVVLPTVAAPENAQIGDEATGNVGEFTVQVTDEAVPAQTTGAPARVVPTVQVHETHVYTDKVITDPNSPEAVQVPDAGRGTLDLPIHALSRETPEAYFSREAAELDKDDPSHQG